jgi:hypothetical protein
VTAVSTDFKQCIACWASEANAPTCSAVTAELLLHSSQASQHACMLRQGRTTPLHQNASLACSTKEELPQQPWPTCCHPGPSLLAQHAPRPQQLLQLVGAHS